MGSKLRRRLRRSMKRNGDSLTAVGLASFGLILIILGLFYYQHLMAPDIYHTNYMPLLNTIAKGESRGNYNAYFGNASNTTIRFTNMTVEQVLQWQQSYVEQGNASNAVGKYQIIRPTLARLIQQQKIKPQTKFNEKLQDKLALALLERRGAREYLANRLTRQEFAANLAKEWAALPKATGDHPEQSYYAGDGLNKVQIPIDEVYGALETLKS